MPVNIKKQVNRAIGDMSSMVFGKIPPQAPELEKAVLGACLLERSVYNTVVQILPEPDCFYVDAHQKIWEAVMGLEMSGNVIDILTVTEQLSRNGKLEEVGGAYYLTRLTMDVVSSAHAEAHARIVAEKYMGRQLIRLCGDMIGRAYDGEDDIFDLLTEANIKLSRIDPGADNANGIPIGTVFRDVLRQLEFQKNHRTALTGVDTGIYELNEITNGWQKSDLIIIGGRPSKGKTALGLNLALSAAISQLVKGVPVAIISAEMSKGQLVKRMVSTVSGIDFGKINSGNLTDEEFKRVTDLSNYFHKLPIYLIDNVREWSKIVAILRKLHEKHDIGLILGDYLGLMRNKATASLSREQQISYISGDSKALAKELEIPFIWLAQLNRDVEKRGKGEHSEPQPSDLRDSGGIEQDADLILFPWHISPDESRISIAKNRSGKVATGDYALKMKFIGSLQKWVSANEAFSFEQTIREDNPRAGIVPNYQNRLPYKDDETDPF